MHRADLRSRTAKGNRAKCRQFGSAVGAIIDRLESRTLLSTVSWVGGDGFWDVASNWQDDASVNRLPTAADDVVINICPLDPWERKRIFDGDIREITIWNVALTSEALKVLQSQAKLP